MCRDKQLGLSMIELLIALAISSFMILGITQIYLDNKRNYSFQLNQETNQDNARYAELILAGWLNKAGYRRDPEQMIEYAFPALSASADCESFARGAVVADYKAGTGEKGVCIRYQPVDSGERDCQGDPVKTRVGTRLVRPFVQPGNDEVVVAAIKFVPGSELHTGTLQCKNLSSAGVPQFVEVVDGIADLQLEYAAGENDIFEKRIKEANPWSSSAAGSGLVRAVRYSLLLSSRPNQRVGDSAILTRWISEVATAANKARIEADDQNRIYHLGSSVISLRNMMP